MNSSIFSENWIFTFVWKKSRYLDANLRYFIIGSQNVGGQICIYLKNIKPTPLSTKTFRLEICYVFVPK